MSASVAGPASWHALFDRERGAYVSVPNNNTPPYTLLLSLMEDPALHADLAHAWRAPLINLSQLQVVNPTCHKLLLLHLLIKQGACLVAAELLRNHLFFW